MWIPFFLDPMLLSRASVHGNRRVARAAASAIFAPPPTFFGCFQVPCSELEPLRDAQL